MFPLDVYTDCTYISFNAFQDGWMPLHIAAQYNTSFEVVKVLVDAGAAVNAATEVNIA